MHISFATNLLLSLFIVIILVTAIEKGVEYLEKK